MLRRLKIGGRLNLLIAVPLLALLASAAMGYVALQHASIRGDEYAGLKSAAELRAATTPPPASLLESWMLVNSIGVLAGAPDGFSAEGLAAIDAELAQLEAARARFEQSMAYWSQQQIELQTVQLDDAGRAFFDGVDNALVPAVVARDADEVLDAIRGLESSYDLQQTWVQRAREWSEAEVAAHERSTDDYLSSVLAIAGALLLALCLGTLVLAWRVRRSIVRPIRSLAAHAREVATDRLPAAVRTMQDLPADAPVPYLPRFEWSSRDEVADLGASFDSVQDAAVDLASAQVAARRVVSDNLSNIARRTQDLLGRSSGFIAKLKRGQRDAEALDDLFRLDHLTTRMRRNAQSVLVLAGVEQTRLRRPAISIGDVLRAALSDVENYGQVELADVGDISVQGAVAGEVKHLLAELLENATSFSPPKTPVTVVGRAVADGHQLAIFDHGVGMAPEELAEANRRLGHVSSFELENSRMIGLQVVARLAARLGIEVRLSHTPGGNGVTALVRLPLSILERCGPASFGNRLPEAVSRLGAPLAGTIAPSLPTAPIVAERPDEAHVSLTRAAAAPT